MVGLLEKGPADDRIILCLGQLDSQKCTLLKGFPAAGEQVLGAQAAAAAGKRGETIRRGWGGFKSSSSAGFQGAKFEGS